MRRPIIALLSLVLVVACVPRASFADAAADTEKARRIFEQAEKKFQSKRYEEALRLYQLANRIRSLPGFLFNIGLCFRNLERHKEALFVFRLYLKKSPNAHNRVLTERLIAEAERKTPAQSQPTRETLDEPPAPPAAEKQRKAPRQPKPNRVVRGEPAAPPQPPKQAKPPAPTKAAPELDDRARRHNPILLWTGVGVTAALLIAGTVTGQMASDRSEEYRDSRTAPTELAGLRDSGHALATTSVVTFAVGAAVGIATLLYYWLGDRKSEDQETIAASLSPSAAGGSVLVRW